MHDYPHGKPGGDEAIEQGGSFIQDEIFEAPPERADPPAGVGHGPKAQVFARVNAPLHRNPSERSLAQSLSTN